MALGTSPNPLLAATTAGLETTRRGCITADERGATTRPGVFAGGDAVTRRDGHQRMGSRPHRGQSHRRICKITCKR